MLCEHRVNVVAKDCLQSTPGKEYITGHKHLAHTIFLWKHKINLTVYSFVDMSFCLFYRTTSSRSRRASHMILFPVRI